MTGQRQLQTNIGVLMTDFRCQLNVTCVHTAEQLVPQESTAADCSRRQALTSFAAMSVATSALRCMPAAAAMKKPSYSDWSSPGLAAPIDGAQPRFFRTKSGAKIQELSVGSGSAAKEGDQVEIEYVLRRSNGYFIYSTVEGVSFQPRDVPIGPIDVKLGDSDVIEGLQEALIGMQRGGKRRVLVPPEAGYAAAPSSLQPQPPTFAGQRQLLNHANEQLLFEIQLVKIR
ncbi:hypothetical protein WJX72_001289 [[Myrmecia] bisecta]|uniref:peptidylprolyl isomerase n=1 Tax=[Myrmecia] bisecta TaxID=41462 RepID=A0AAW1R4F0_9CHLO